MEAILNTAQTLIAESSPLAKYCMLAGASGAVFCFYGLFLVIYRLYFDPLAGFPGPKIAAATRWYEFYYDVIKRGRYIYKIEEMHKKYGMMEYFFFPLWVLGNHSTVFLESLLQHPFSVDSDL